MSQFRDITDAQVSAVFLSEDHFAEPFVFQPKDGIGRTISAIVQRNGQAEKQETHHATTQETITVVAARNGTTGILNPQIGDGGRLPDDPDTRLWDFQSVDQSQTDDALIACVFIRATLRRAGQKNPASL